MQKKPMGGPRGAKGAKGAKGARRPMGPRFRTARPIKFSLPKDAKIEYKNIALLQKFVTERGKIVSRRASGLSAKQQRDLAQAVKWARYLALLPSGSAKRK